VETQIRRLLAAYPAIFMACHRRHVRDDETGAVVTAHQASILDHLELQRASTLTELADHLGIGRSAMSIQIDRLVRRGYVRRRATILDARKVALTLTDAGNRIKKHNTVLDPVRVRSMFAAIPAAELEVALQGIEQLAKYARALTRGNTRGRRA
jgi:MarR family transcriptional regulator, organic hydroperoxide resistance regulator